MPMTAQPLPQKYSTDIIMLNVLLALIPGTLAMVYYFGWGVLINILIATVFATCSEAFMLRLRDKSISANLLDYSALVSAWLFALALPPLLPWWATATGISFAMIFAKHLYGGLGNNPFNPAMVAYAVILISFPKEMTLWLNPQSLLDSSVGLLEALRITLFSTEPSSGWDSITSATPLDTMRSQLQQMQTIEEIKSSPLFGDFGGRGWEWVANWYFIGGAWLLYKKLISWHIPVAVLLSIAVFASLFYIVDPDSHASPGFHIFSGGTALCAFFIATDPVTSCTSRYGKLIFGCGVGLLIYTIRTWGGYPDGVAFAILLMNMAAPYIDHYSKPRVYGQHG